MQLGKVIDILDAILQDNVDVMYDFHIPEARCLRSRAIRMQFIWTGNLTAHRSCTQAAIAMNSPRCFQNSTGPGHPKIQLNLDQVELIRSAE